MSKTWSLTSGTAELPPFCKCVTKRITMRHTHTHTHIIIVSINTEYKMHLDFSNFKIRVGEITYLRTGN